MFRLGCTAGGALEVNPGRTICAVEMEAAKIATRKILIGCEFS